MKKTILMTLLVVGMLLTGCGAKESSPASEQTEQTEETSAVKFEKAEKVNVLDSDCVAVYTEYTNETKSAVLPADDVSVKAHQNGTELSPIVPTGEKTNGYDQCDTSVEQGATAKIVWIFQLSDQSKVTLDLDGQKQEVELKYRRKYE